MSSVYQEMQRYFAYVLTDIMSYDHLSWYIDNARIDRDEQTVSFSAGDEEKRYFVATTLFDSTGDITAVHIWTPKKTYVVRRRQPWSQIAESLAELVPKFRPWMMDEATEEEPE